MIRWLRVGPLREAQEWWSPLRRGRTRRPPPAPCSSLRQISLPTLPRSASSVRRLGTAPPEHALWASGGSPPPHAASPPPRTPGRHAGLLLGRQRSTPALLGPPSR